MVAAALQVQDAWIDCRRVSISPCRTVNDPRSAARSKKKERYLAGVWRGSSSGVAGGEALSAQAFAPSHVASQHSRLAGNSERALYRVRRRAGGPIVTARESARSGQPSATIAGAPLTERGAERRAIRRAILLQAFGAACNASVHSTARSSSPATAVLPVDGVVTGRWRACSAASFRTRPAAANSSSWLFAAGHRGSLRPDRLSGCFDAEGGFSTRRTARLADPCVRRASSPLIECNSRAVTRGSYAHRQLSRPICLCNIALWKLAAAVALKKKPSQKSVHERPPLRAASGSDALLIIVHREPVALLAISVNVFILPNRRARMIGTFGLLPYQTSHYSRHGLLGGHTTPRRMLASTFALTLRSGGP